MERTAGFRLKRIGIWLARLALLGVAGIGLLFTLLWRERNQSVELPTPTGPYAIGRTIFDWTDDNALDTLAPTAGTKRELLVWIWYPAASGQSAVADDYVPAYIRTALGPATGPMSYVTRDVSKVQAHSLRNADVASQPRSFPVVVMRAGASAPVVGYSTLAEDLASHGYIVVGFDAPYRTGVVVFPDGRVIRRTQENNPELCAEKPLDQQASCMSKLLTAWTRDTAFVLDRLERLNALDGSGKFTGRLDMTRVGMFGHSFGGATALQFCHDDPRCKAGINLDGQPFGSVIQEGLSQPFMFLLSGHGNSSDPISRQIQANIQSIYDNLPGDTRLKAEIRGGNHFLFGDDGALMKSHILLWVLRRLGIVGIDGRRQLAVTTYCIHSFFDVYLKGTSSSRLDIASPIYPELQSLD
jgi:predicted dienelactone hydrolase